MEDYFMKIKTTKKNWTITGINLVPSDSIYEKLVSAIESGNLSERYLQQITGSCAPITVNMQARSIAFSNF